MLVLRTFAYPADFKGNSHTLYMSGTERNGNTIIKGEIIILFILAVIELYFSPIPTVDGIFGTVISSYQHRTIP